MAERRQLSYRSLKVQLCAPHLNSIAHDWITIHIEDEIRYRRSASIINVDR
jgi:hypothetical protein